MGVGKALGNAFKAGKGTKAVFKLDATTILWLLGSSIGFFPLVLLAVVALIVLIIILALFGASTTMNADPSATASGSLPKGTQQMIDMYGGDGTGTFAPSKVPDPDLATLIKNAAGKCDLLTPVIMAAQIEYASGFDAKKEGGAGRKGLSQLTPEAFREHGKDSDKNGETTVLDAADDIHAHAAYFCHLAGEVQKMLDAGDVVGDPLTLTFMAWDVGLESVRANGGMPVPSQSGYAFQVRLLFANYTTGAAGGPTKTPEAVQIKKENQERGTVPALTEARFAEIFPNRAPFYSYAALAGAMAKYPAFASTGDEQARGRELAAFLGNVDHESQGLRHTEELDRGVWGNYCDSTKSYGCPAGTTAYHGRGPIQLSWNYNYQAAGDALGRDLLNEPDLVKSDPAIAWETAMWFWMNRTGTGPTAHDAITGSGGFGATIRAINGIECGGGNPGQVSSRIAAYKRIAGILGAEPGADSTLIC